VKTLKKGQYIRGCVKTRLQSTGTQFVNNQQFNLRGGQLLKYTKLGLNSPKIKHIFFCLFILILLLLIPIESPALSLITICVGLACFVYTWLIPFIFRYVVIDEKGVLRSDFGIKKKAKWLNIKGVILTNAQWYSHYIINDMGSNLIYKDKSGWRREHIPGVWISFIGEDIDIGEKIYSYDNNMSLKQKYGRKIVADLLFRKDVLTDIIQFYSGKFYIQEDVYLRKEGEIALMLKENNISKERLVIIPDNKVIPNYFENEEVKIMEQYHKE
jgi:hypothetical protein